MARKGGRIAGNARREIGAETDKPVIGSKSVLDFSRLIKGVTNDVTAIIFDDDDDRNEDKSSDE